MTATPHPFTPGSDLAPDPVSDRTRSRAASRHGSRRWLLAATVATSVALLGACAGQESTSAAAQTPVATTQPLPPGQAQYQKSCARCHGVAMQGRNGTPAMDPQRISTQSDQMLQMLIQYGKGKMPAFGGLSLDQINNVIGYLRGL